MKRWLIMISMSIFICGFALIAWADEPINLVVNEENIKPDIAPQIIDNRVMVPIRWVAEALGADVKWDNQSKTVIIKTGTDSLTNPNNKDDATIINELVKDFGQKMKNVSLLAPEDMVNKSIQENYGDLASVELVNKWQNNHTLAPGRATSSPWPENIEITNMEKLSDSKYQIKGEIIEITNAEMLNGGYTAKRPIIIVAEQIDKNWLITSFKLDDYQSTIKPIIYQNSEYGFSFELPESWQDYRIIEEEWEAFSINSPNNTPTQQGPLFLIRHPNWTNETPRQDIPIMVFTPAEWDSLQNREFHVGAAPIDPKELGRNKQYIFALPARYNFAFPAGYEEVDEILENNPLNPLG